MFDIHQLFDLRQTAHSELFDSVQYPWEVVSRIAAYCDYALASPTRAGATIHPTAVIGEQVTIGEGTVVEAFATIKGPCIIGKRSIIRSGAYIREHAIIGDDCVVGNSSELKNALLFNEVSMPHFNYAGDSVLGYKVHLGGGAVLSNSKSTNGPIRITTLEKTIDTGLEKLGAIIGDHTELGSGAVTLPGAIIGAHSVIYPLAMIRGVVAAHSIVKVRQQHEVTLKRDE